MAHGLKRWTMRLGAAAAILSMAVVGGVGHVTSTAQAGSVSGGAPFVYEDGVAETASTAKFTTLGGQYVLSTTKTVPYFTGSYTSAGTTYSYQMVGSRTSPTTVPFYIIPVKLNFSVGSVDPAYIASGRPYSLVRDATPDVAGVINSPVFQGAQASNGCSTSGKTQYGTAEQAETLSGLNVKVCVAAVEPTVTVNVPQNQAALVRITSARVDAKWFSNLENTLDNQFHVPSTAVPLVLLHNTYLYENNDPVNHCCILGWHGAATGDVPASGNVNGNGNQAVQTYMFASWLSYGLFGLRTPNGIITAPIADIHGLSHEVGEWLNDPFVHNFAPSWSVPFEPQYGCSGIIEVGDPLVGYSPNFAPTGWHPQDLILAPWFMRPATAPSSGYTYPDNAAYLAGWGASGMDQSSPGC